MEIINGVPYKFDLSHNLYAYRAMKEIHLAISFTPCIINKYNDNIILLKDMYDVFSYIGLNKLQDYTPHLAFSLFKESDKGKVLHLFMDDVELMAYDFLLPAMEEIKEIILDDEDDSDLFYDMQSGFKDISNLADIIDYAMNAKLSVDNIFKKINENKEEIEMFLEERYTLIASLIQNAYVFDNICNPDFILDFDGKNCGVFCSNISTTYFLPYGI